MELIEILRAQRAIIAENLEKWDRMIAEEEARERATGRKGREETEPLGVCV